MKRTPSYLAQPTGLAALLAAVLLASGCSWLTNEDGMFRDRGNDYRKASVEPGIKLPETIQTESIEDTYAIPPISDRTSLSDEFEVPRPESLRELNSNSVRINKLGLNRWILVDGAPGQVWPRLRGFLNLNQLGVARADATAGILETAWLQPNTEGVLKERYRLRIEQGIQRGTSEVYVLQSDLRAGQDGWPQHSSNGEREQIMVQELAQYLADSQAAAAVSMLAQQAIDSQGRVLLKEDEQGQPYLELRLPFARAWASTHSALEKANFVVEDHNRKGQLFYLSYKNIEDNAEEPGFFASLFSGKKKDDAESAQLSIKEQSADTVLLSLQDNEGNAMPAADAKRLLKRIQRHLS